ncbi:hypothetical protein Asp14428_12190 [Actinoplanes sp. NBRC 14428]|nr:hypothetical protein Asp14428_12190 [Actinoplanes sp. NBRC 14428]
MLHAAVTLARSEAPGVEVRCLALPGYAVPVLLHAAETADLLVVGARPAGRLPGLPSGSVGAQVATHAKRSVAVVRGHAAADGPVLAGADDGPDAGTVVGRAFEEAALRDAPLVAITARAGGGADPAGPPLGGDPDALLDPWREKYPGVTAHREIVTGRPDVVLTERTANAQLVVVGPRRHGFEGVLLGAAGSRLLRHAACPVLIARP